MNLRKEDPLLAEFERSLGRILMNWTGRYSAPRDARTKLMRAAGQIQRDRAKGLQGILESRGRHETNAQELAILFYAPQFGYMAALMHF